MGLRKIRARLLNMLEEPWPEEVIQACLPTAVSIGSDQRDRRQIGKPTRQHDQYDLHLLSRRLAISSVLSRIRAYPSSAYLFLRRVARNPSKPDFPCSRSSGLSSGICRNREKLGGAPKRWSGTRQHWLSSSSIW